MKPSSAKNKGRRLQQWVAQQLVKIIGVHPEDVESRPMGSGGEDVIIGIAGRALFPYSVECKNTERLNVWNAIYQARQNCPQSSEPLIVFKRNGETPMVAVDAVHFFELVRRANDERPDSE